MTRSLPPEVKQQVLAEALALAHSAADRHHARHALRSVSREWRGALDGWHALDVAGTEQAARLKAQFNTARSRLGTLNRVKLVWVEVDSVRGFDKQGKLARLLELLTNAESVVILTGSTTLVETDRTRVFSDSVGLALIKALSSLKRVKHFRLSSTNCQPDDLPLIDEHYLHQLLSSWPHHHSVDLSRAILHPKRRQSFRNLSQILKAEPPRLSQLAIHFPAGKEVYFAPPATLSVSLTVLAVSGPGLLTSPAQVRYLTRAVLGWAPSLREFSLRDSLCTGRVTKRGAYDALVPRLARLVKLAINPCAVTNLADALGPLSCLQALSLLYDQVDPTEAVSAAEMVGVIHCSASLAMVSISTHLWGRWSELDQAAIEAAAARKAVRIEWG